MNARNDKTQVAGRLLRSLLGAAVCCAVAAPPSSAAEDAPAAQPPGAAQASAALPSATAEGFGGMTIHIDPKTGAILSQPAPGSEALQFTPDQQRAFSTSQQGLREVAGTEPGGGIKVDLQGRFQSPLIATMGADGKVRMQHAGEPAAAGHDHAADSKK